MVWRGCWSPSPAEVAAIAARSRAAPLVAFDLEFVSQDRLVPTLCLVQVAWLGEHASLDAPVGRKSSRRTAGAARRSARRRRRARRRARSPPIRSSSRTRRARTSACSRRGSARACPGIIDTQLMAAFVGHRRPGRARRARATSCSGVTLAKEQQWTDWARAPAVSDAQLAYAAADVRHLPRDLRACSPRGSAAARVGARGERGRSLRRGARGRRR